MLWILLVTFYGLAKGGRDVLKKISFRTCTTIEVLFLYTLFTFIFCLLEAPSAMGLPTKYYFLIMIKSICIFIGWLASFKAISKMPISIYGLLDLSAIIFSTLIGVFILREKMSFSHMIGFCLVILGLSSLKLLPMIKAKIFKNSEDTLVVDSEQHISLATVGLCLLGCFMNAISGYLDKIYMRDLNSAQLQFWYMFYLVILYGLYILIKRIRISKTAWKCGWIYLMAFLFFLGDKALFIANSDPTSKFTVMTLIKQSACVISIICGRILFNEKNVVFKLFCAAIVITGIILSVM